MHTYIYDVKTHLYRALQFGGSASLAILVTGVLLLLMSSLIDTHSPEVVDEVPTIPTFTMPEDRTIDNHTKQEIEKPLEPEDAPPVPKPVSTTTTTDFTYAVNAPAVDVDGMQVATGSYSGTAVPAVRVEPRYPTRALNRGIEGYVDLVFDIGASGKTENIRILRADPEGYFEKASIAALKRWKYKPAYDGEVAMAQRDQTTRLRFSLNQ